MNFPNNQAPLLRTREAAARVGLAESTLEPSRRRPPFFKVSRKRVVCDVGELDAWARAKRFASTSEQIEETAD